MNSDIASIHKIDISYNFEFLTNVLWKYFGITNAFRTKHHNFCWLLLQRALNRCDDQIHATHHFLQYFTFNQIRLLSLQHHNLQKFELCKIQAPMFTFANFSRNFDMLMNSRWSSGQLTDGYTFIDPTLQSFLLEPDLFH